MNQEKEEMIDFNDFDIPKENHEEVNDIEINFLSELKEFMYDFAKDELDIESINEPTQISMSQANYFVKMYNELIRQKEEVDKLCDEEIDRTKRAVEIYRESRTKTINGQLSFFENILKQYLIAETENKKSKSIKLPYGTISLRKQQPKYEYKEEKDIIEFIKNLNTEFISSKVVESLDKKAIKQNGQVKNGRLYIDGVLVPNVEINEQEQKFEVKLNK